MCQRLNSCLWNLASYMQLYLTCFHQREPNVFLFLSDRGPDQYHRECYFLNRSDNLKMYVRNWVFATTRSNLLIPISLQPDGDNIWYFKLKLFALIEIKVWIIWGLRHWVVKIQWLENQSLCQRRISFESKKNIFSSSGCSKRASRNLHSWNSSSRRDSTLIRLTSL